jgi:hypothetical protein
MKAFDTNALQLDPDFVGRLCETLIYCAYGSKPVGSTGKCATKQSAATR